MRKKRGGEDDSGFKVKDILTGAVFLFLYLLTLLSYAIQWGIRLIPRR